MSDLVAVGQTNGRTRLVRLHAISTLSQGQSGGQIGSQPNSGVATPSAPVALSPGGGMSSHSLMYPELPVRNARACNVVAFSDSSPNLLVCGLDKVRTDYSVNVWDIEMAREKAAEVIASTSTSTVSTPSHVFPPTSSNSSSLREAESSGHGRSSRAGHSGPPLAPSTQALQAIADELRPLRQFGLSEAVTSAVWVPNSPHKLLAGMGMKAVRLYDIRSGESSGSNSSSSSQSSSPISIPTKAVYGIAPDPFHEHRFASYQEDGIVRIWDLRKPVDPVLSLHVAAAPGSSGFSSSTSSSTSHSSILPSSSGGKSQPIDVIAWSPRVTGLLATHQRDAMSVRLWEMQEGTTRIPTSTTAHTDRTGKSTSDTPTGSTGHGNPFFPGFMGTNSNSPGEGKFGFSGFFGGGGGGGGGGDTTVVKVSESDSYTDVPVLWRTRQTKPSVRLISSFAWIPTETSSGTGRLVLAARDGTVDAVTIRNAARLAWAPRGNLIILGDRGVAQRYGPAESGELVGSGGGGIDGEVQAHSGVDGGGGGGGEGTTDYHTPQYGGHGYYGSRRVSHGLAGLEERLEILERNGRILGTGPRCQGQRGSTRGTGVTGGNGGGGGGGAAERNRVNLELCNDISVVMRLRAQEGYNMNAEENTKLLKDTSLCEVWAWLARKYSKGERKGSMSERMAIFFFSFFPPFSFIPQRENL